MTATTSRCLATLNLGRTPEYHAWWKMIDRCLHPKSQDYKNYGARGITVCERWQESVNNFIADMGLRPGDGYSLERKNNNGNYEPSNCKWGTKLEQGRNRRTVWTATERAQLKASLAKGKTYEEAGKEVGRSKGSTGAIANRLGLRSARGRHILGRDPAYERELLEAFEAMERAKGYL